jgi:hypothetical protein
MKLFTLPGLRLGQLQTVGDSSIKICTDFTELAPELAKVKASFADFKDGMSRDKTTAEIKRALDVSRDHKVSGFSNVVFEEKKFPNKDEAILSSHKDLLKIVNNYGRKITRLSRAEETAAIDNMLADIAKIDFTPLIPTGIPRWIPEIAFANEEFKKGAAAYIDGSTEDDAIKSASDLAPALEQDLNELYAMLYATIKRTPSEELKKAYAKLEKLIDSMR